MVTNIVLCITFYFLGAIVCYCSFQPMRSYEQGFKSAEKFYGNFDLGFEKGYECAKKHFTNWDEGFGYGFEAGWETALEQEKKKEPTP